MYEISIESFNGIQEKQIIQLETIEKVLKEVKSLFDKGYKVMKIKNLLKPIEFNEKLEKII